MRKVAVSVVNAQEKETDCKKVSVSENNVKDFLGKPIFTTDRYYERTPVGVCMGLAWTSLGGATLYVEATKVHAEKTEMKLTGQVGDVMKESSQIAWTFLHSQINRYAPGRNFFEKSQVHLHIPEGATPKDGPSAGITMVTALLSLLKDQPVIEDLGMTGELTLTGKILPIGGVKEKLIAAKRSGAKVLIFPLENQRDYDELPAYVKKGIQMHFVSHYDEVFDVAFGK
jgi:ATP-dependent Lon protease